MRGSDGTAAVASAVRAEMARRGLRQVDLAVMLQLSQAAVSRKVHGEIPFSVAEVYEIADEFGVDVHELMPEAPPPLLMRPRGRRRPRQPAGYGMLLGPQLVGCGV